jgi:hypothetical protein
VNAVLVEFQVCPPARVLVTVDAFILHVTTPVLVTFLIAKKCHAFSARDPVVGNATVVPPLEL